MIETILVPLDGSTFSEYALPIARGFAKRYGAALRLALVHVPIPTALIDGVPQASMDIEGRAREHEQSYLEALTERLRDEDGFDVEAAHLDGPVVGTLETHARSVGADLIVMSTHGRGGLSRAWLGSVADGLARRAPVPVLLVRPDTETEPSPEPAGTFRHILVPLDGSPFAEEALDFAAEIARRDGAACTLVRVVVPIPTVTLPLIDPALNLEFDDIAARRTAAREYLERVAEGLREDGIEVSTEVEAHPQPATAILEVGERVGADLVALSIHGRTGVPRMILGSVSDKIVRGGTTPVLLHRPAQNEG